MAHLPNVTIATCEAVGGEVGLANGRGRSRADIPAIRAGVAGLLHNDISTGAATARPSDGWHA